LGETGGEESATFRILPAPGADYHFYLDVESEEATLGAWRNGASPSEYFWYHPFEDWRYRRPRELEAAFHAEIRCVLTRPTRIIQHRDWLTWHFRCEYEAGEGWRPVYGHALLRGNRGVPPTEGWERVYHSPALVHAASGG
jgi:hypothetical protein